MGIIFKAVCDGCGKDSEVSWLNEVPPNWRSFNIIEPRLGPSCATINIMACSPICARRGLEKSIEKLFSQPRQ